MTDVLPLLDRRETVAALLRDRRDLLVVTGLGSATYDAAAAGTIPATSISGARWAERRPWRWVWRSRNPNAWCWP